MKLTGAILKLSAPQENHFPCLFQFIKAPYIPWLMLPSTIFKTHTLTPASLVKPAFTDFDTLTPYSNPCDYIRPTPII